MAPTSPYAMLLEVVPRHTVGRQLARLGPTGFIDAISRSCSRGPKKGVRKMDRKKDPQKIDFWRLLDRDGARGGGSLLASGLEIDDIVILFRTPCTPEGAAD